MRYSPSVQFDGRIMDVSTSPTGTFSLTHPISLAPLPVTGTVRIYSATGHFTLHGHSRLVTFTVSAKRTGQTISISGSIPVTFADWSIPNPSFGSFVTTQNHGVLEFLLNFGTAQRGRDWPDPGRYVGHSGRRVGQPGRQVGQTGQPRVSPCWPASKSAAGQLPGTYHHLAS
ncbi:MAG TPA: YceI family protein [Streptosporangiaceae bacterium]|nr:YceI family protein [Streptosporangiaceae bacterium]